MIFPNKHGAWSWCVGARLGFPTLAVVLLASCSSEEPTGSVTGKVTLDDAPVVAGTVLFLSDDGRAASAELQPDGTYTLECRLGQFKVAVAPPVPPGAEAALDAPESDAGGVDIPPQYQDVGSSGLTTEVKEGTNRFDISLSSGSTTR
jgi:hypothetical protein